MEKYSRYSALLRSFGSGRNLVMACLAMGACAPVDEDLELGDVGVAESSLGNPVNFKVLTLNVWTATSAQDMAQAINQSGADVAAIQEMSYQQASAVAQQLNWDFAQTDADQEAVVFSRFPILKKDGQSTVKGGLGATILVQPHLRVHVYSVHTEAYPYGPYSLQDGASVSSAVRDEETTRLPGVQQVLNVAATYVASAEPTFLAGDFNAPSHLDYAPSMPWPVSLAVQNAGFVDSYAQLYPNRTKRWACQFGQNEPGISWARLASQEPRGCFDRIDFINYSQGDAVVLASQTLDISVSDHRGVLTTFEISEPNRAATPSSPLPRVAQTGAHRHPVLSWIPATNAVTHRVYVGPTSTTMQLVATTTDSQIIPSLLSYNAAQYWRVDTDTTTGTITGSVWSFNTRASAGFQPNKLVYARGEAISVAFDNATLAGDWVGLYARRGAYGSNGANALSWKYTNNSTTKPSKVVKTGTLTLTAPSTAGQYVIRFLQNDGYAVQDDLNITVQ